MTLSLWKGDVTVAPPKPTMGQILLDTAIKHGVTVHALRGKSRAREVSNARQEAMWLMYATDLFSLPQIARFLGDRDHTTVLHGTRAHQARMMAE